MFFSWSMYVGFAVEGDLKSLNKSKANCFGFTKNFVINYSFHVCVGKHKNLNCSLLRSFSLNQNYVLYFYFDADADADTVLFNQI